MRRLGEEEGKKLRCGFDLIFNAADRKTIASAKVRWDDPGNSAHIERSGEVAQMDLRRNRRAGIWQVVLREQVEQEAEDLEPYPSSPFPQPGEMRRQAIASIKSKRYADITRAFRETQARIDNGQLTTAAAAQAELITKLTAASAAAAKARAAIPPRMRERPPQ